MIGGEWVAGRLKGYRYTVVRCGKVGTSVRWVTEGTNSMSPKVLAVHCRQCCRWLQPFPPLPPPRLSRGMHMVGEGEAFGSSRSQKLGRRTGRWDGGLGQRRWDGGRGQRRWDGGRGQRRWDGGLGQRRWDGGLGQRRWDGGRGQRRRDGGRGRWEGGEMSGVRDRR